MTSGWKMKKKSWISGSWARESEGNCGKLVLGNVHCLYCILLRKHDLWQETSALHQAVPSPCLTAPVCLCNTTDVNEAAPVQGSEESGKVISSQLCFDAFKTQTFEAFIIKVASFSSTFCMYKIKGELYNWYLCTVRRDTLILESVLSEGKGLLWILYL